MAAYLALVLSNTAIGLALGFLTQMVFTAVEIAGSLADLSSGFSYGQVLDPMSGAFSAAFARLMTVCFGALLFATDAYQVVLRGFASSFRSLPLLELPTLDAAGAGIIAKALTGTMVAALEIGAPLLGVLFLTDVALALASRFVPQANAMSVGIPVKALVSLTAAGAMLTMLPQHLEGLVEPAVLLPGRVFG
jgi:flagellar biosynthetic protein FliR